MTIVLKATFAAFVSFITFFGASKSFASPSRAPVSFEGVWSVAWCDKNRPDSDCGGFTALLVQDGDRVCGRYGAARPGLTQIDEGKPRSVRGVVVGSSAVVAVTSGRSDGTYLVRLDRKDGDMHWQMVEQVGAPDNGDIQLIALHEQLRRGDPASEHDQLAVVKDECAR